MGRRTVAVEQRHDSGALTMCAPIAAVAAMASIAGTAYSVVQTQKNASAQAKALNLQASKQREQIYQEKSMQADQRKRLAQEERARLRPATP